MQRATIVWLSVLVIGYFVADASGQSKCWQRYPNFINTIDHLLIYDSVRGEVLRFGGRCGGGTLIDQIWRWDGASWSLKAQHGPITDAQSAAAFDSNRRIVVGYTGSTTWEWDGQQLVQLTTPGPPSTRRSMSMAFDSQRNLMVALVMITYNVSETWEWDGLSWARRNVNGIPGIYYPSMVYDASRGTCVAIGGPNNDETWEWNGVEWTLQISGGPPVVGDHSLVYDSDRNVVLLYGGPEVWERHGNVWSGGDPNSPVSDSPPFVYDAVRHVAVGLRSKLFENVINMSIIEWDGTQFQYPFSSSGSPVVFGYAVEFDAERELIVRSGGWAIIGGRYYFDAGGSWIWNRITWERVADGPRGLSPSMVYDSLRHVMVGFGGKTYYEFSYDGATREWDGNSWSVKSTSGPLGRAGAQMIFDRNRGVSIMFGGFSDPWPPNNDIWEWDGVSWSRHPAPWPPISGSVVYYLPHNRIAMIGLSEIWDWDGTSWTRNGNINLPTIGYLFGFDASGNICKIFAGDSTVWEYENNEWINRVYGRSDDVAGDIVYDSVRDEYVIVGSNDCDPMATWVLQPCADSVTITSRPYARYMHPGESTTFEVQTTGTVNNYQWFREYGNQPVADSDRISGSTSPVLTILGLKSADAGQYYCYVTGPTTYAKSQWEKLTVCAGDFNRDGQVLVGDIFAMLTDWFQQMGQTGSGFTADIDRDGVVAVADIFAFLNFWFAEFGTCGN